MDRGKRMIRQIELDHRQEVLQLLSVQMAAYMVEARLIGFDDIPPLKDSVDSLRQSGEVFYGYFSGRELWGAISYKRDGAVLDIHRLMVHPEHFRQGVASCLLQFVETVESGVKKITVSTGAKNHPAKNLYRHFGYVEVDERELPEGVKMSFFEKAI